MFTVSASWSRTISVSGGYSGVPLKAALLSLEALVYPLHSTPHEADLGLVSGNAGDALGSWYSLVRCGGQVAGSAEPCVL